MTPKTAIWDIYKVRVDCNEPKFVPYIIRVPAMSAEDANAKARDRLDEKRLFTLTVVT